MRILYTIRTPLVLCISFFVLALGVGTRIINPATRQGTMDRFSHQLEKKIDQTQRLLEETARMMDSADSITSSWFFEKLWYTDLFEKEELGVVISREGNMAYWSDPALGFPQLLDPPGNGLLKLPNGWYFHQSIEKEGYVLHGLTLIKYAYPIENKYLKNRFAKGFNLPDEYDIIGGAAEGAYPVYYSGDVPAFSIQYRGIPCAHSLLLLPSLLFFLALLMFLNMLYRVMVYSFHRYRGLKLMLVLLLLMGLYALITYAKFPGFLFLLRIFSPEWFAFTSFWPSLGQFLLFSSLVFFWSLLVFRIFDIPERWKSDSRIQITGFLSGLVFLAVFFALIRFLFHALVLNSGISFALFQIREISLYSFFGYLSLGFLLFSFLLMSMKLVQIYRKLLPVKKLLFSVIGVFAVLSLLFLGIDTGSTWRLSGFYLIILFAVILLNQKGMFSHRLSFVVIQVFGFALFTLLLQIRFVEEHENKVQETLVINLSAEHDPTAELFLYDLDRDIKADSLLPTLFRPPFEEVEDYLRRKHFTGYFREYDLQATVCFEDDSLVIQPGNLTRSCFPFFDSMLVGSGSQIPGTNFYFMDNANGRITYFGKMGWKLPGQPSLNLYIELNSKLHSEGAGFPELLIPESSFENRLKNHFSYAKYSQGKLVDRGGSFLYALSAEAYDLQTNTLQFRRWDGNDHCIYGYSDHHFILVSREYARLSDYLVSFPYLFVFYFFFSLAINRGTRPFAQITEKGKSLRRNIQLSIIGIVLVSLLITGGGTLFYIVSQYQVRHQKELIDRMNSVSIEVETVLDHLPPGHPDAGNLLSAELIRLSDVFRTDIHLFSLSGQLMATSRPEIFNKGLLSPNMNNEAFINMSLFRLPRYLHKEHISGMDFLSAYIPLLDGAGMETGYLNLPYFTQQREFSQEITTFILAFINLYVFLLLASILVAYFIAEKMTGPLKLIRDNLRSVQLGKNPRPIRYVSNDEIGALVLEYNNKVEELAASADLLARSERESAWREMARQIAHEIKNPLTPMKLNIQFLQRSEPSDSLEYKQKVQKVAKTLIEQIDNLSAIASEFSNFAKMPRARNERFRLAERLIEIIGLYDYADDCEFEAHLEGTETLEVFADKEQFSRALINLIKNAQQAIPENRKGRIRISLHKENDHARIEVADNGKGISNDLQERIFMPNFTTKTSGTGLGLAITKNIIESFGGTIGFQSKEDEGTSFFIRIPLAR
ncbi:MAG TPA: ATP-binding protein [Prolixibacteraceae bacterium]|nr:ATP-binding protein [Prolixibacteraceae bacterium]